MNKYNNNWKEIKRTAHYHTIKNERPTYDLKLVQFGPPRSGTTVVYQILCALMSESTKTHSPPSVINFEPDYWVCTCRDPRDMICSYWRVNNNVNAQNCDTNKMDQKNIDYYYADYEKYFKMYKDYAEKSNVIWLKYEKYYNNFDVIFDALENTMDIRIDLHMRNMLKEEHSLSANKRFSNQYNGFGQYDNNDLSGLHGNHIFTGKPGSWKQLVHENAHQHMNDIFATHLKAWKYE